MKLTVCVAYITKTSAFASPKQKSCSDNLGLKCFHARHWQWVSATFNKYIKCCYNFFPSVHLIHLSVSIKERHWIKIACPASIEQGLKYRRITWYKVGVCSVFQMHSQLLRVTDNLKPLEVGFSDSSVNYHIPPVKIKSYKYIQHIGLDIGEQCLKKLTFFTGWRGFWCANWTCFEGFAKKHYNPL